MKECQILTVSELLFLRADGFGYLERLDSDEDKVDTSELEYRLGLFFKLEKLYVYFFNCINTYMCIFTYVHIHTLHIILEKKINSLSS